MSPRRTALGVGRSRLRWLLGLLFVALAVPSAVLVVHTQRQLKWEAFHQQRQLAVELADRIDGRLRQLVSTEEARGITDYAFLNVAGLNVSAQNNRSALLQRSPLAEFPVRSEIPGLLGWFQVDMAGAFSSPLLPDPIDDGARYGLTPSEVTARRALQEQLLDVLGRNALVERRRQVESAVAEETRVRELDQARGDAEASSAESAGGRSASAAAPVRLPASISADAGPALRDRTAELEIAERQAPEPQAAPEAAPAYREQGVLIAQREAPAAAASKAQVAFDQLKLPSNGGREQGPGAFGNVADLRLENVYSDRGEQGKAERPVADLARGRRQEKVALPAIDADSLADAAVDQAPAVVPLRTFDSELDPFEFAQLGSGHFVLFRRVWRNGERSIQGAVIEQAGFLHGALGEPFSSSRVAPGSDLLVAWQGGVLQRFASKGGRDYLDRNDALSGTLLHRARLSAPLADMELIWTIRALPSSAGASLVAWAGLVLFAVLLAGFFTLYRLGLRQLTLARQQQDFIAAVSHELKTPLTSIRMYGELLRAGWASEDKKREYYDYIHDESERLSRLIANVLQLARLEREAFSLELKAFEVATVFDLIRSRVQAQIERAGFELSFELDQGIAAETVQVDADAVVQIMINLVDNALKFSSGAPLRRIQIRVLRVGKQAVGFCVRDFGPGVPAALRRRIFELFFRAGNELTRETQGTGIGLALVRQLAQGMRGEIEVEACDPGVEFCLSLPCSSAA